VVPGYRLYLYYDAQKPDGPRSIARAITLECDDDDHAIGEVEQHSDGRYMELWERGRMVKAFDANPRPEDPPGAPSPSRSA
jgi:hypothetical protein